MENLIVSAVVSAGLYWLTLTVIALWLCIRKGGKMVEVSQSPKRPVFSNIISEVESKKNKNSIKQRKSETDVEFNLDLDDIGDDGSGLKVSKKETKETKTLNKIKSDIQEAKILKNSKEDILGSDKQLKQEVMNSNKNKKLDDALSNSKPDNLKSEQSKLLIENVGLAADEKDNKNNIVNDSKPEASETNKEKLKFKEKLERSLNESKEKTVSSNNKLKENVETSQNKPKQDEGDKK